MKPYIWSLLCFLFYVLCVEDHATSWAPMYCVIYGENQIEGTIIYTLRKRPHVSSLTSTSAYSN